MLNFTVQAAVLLNLSCSLNTDQIDENLKLALQKELNVMAPGLTIQVGSFLTGNSSIFHSHKAYSWKGMEMVSCLPVSYGFQLSTGHMPICLLSARNIFLFPMPTATTSVHPSVWLHVLHWSVQPHLAEKCCNSTVRFPSMLLHRSILSQQICKALAILATWAFRKIHLGLRCCPFFHGKLVIMVRKERLCERERSDLFFLHRSACISYICKHISDKNKFLLFLSSLQSQPSSESVSGSLSQPTHQHTCWR